MRQSRPECAVALSENVSRVCLDEVSYIAWWCCRPISSRVRLRRKHRVVILGKGHSDEKEEWEVGGFAGVGCGQMGVRVPGALERDPSRW